MCILQSGKYPASSHTFKFHTTQLEMTEKWPVSMHRYCWSTESAMATMPQNVNPATMGWGKSISLYEQHPRSIPMFSIEHGQVQWVQGRASACMNNIQEVSQCSALNMVRYSGFREEHQLVWTTSKKYPNVQHWTWSGTVGSGKSIGKTSTTWEFHPCTIMWDDNPCTIR